MNHLENFVKNKEEIPKVVKINEILLIKSKKRKV